MNNFSDKVSTSFFSQVLFSQAFGRMRSCIYYFYLIKYTKIINMDCFGRFLFWLNFKNIPESERSILSDLQKLGKENLINACKNPY